MKTISKHLALLLVFALAAGFCACGTGASAENSEKASIEAALNLANMGSEWTYSDSSDAWTLSVVTAVVNPEIENQQGVSVCVPGAYVKGIDTDGDGEADATDGTAVGNMIIDYDATVTSTNGQTYTASTAPVILNTGAAGYGSSTNTAASSSYAAEGYINVSCGNRGKQDTATDSSGNTYYTGDAPSCLVDQKNAARFVKYNILLGNLPGDVGKMISTGGSGGGAHAAMFAATSNNPDFYDYEIACGAVGVYKNEDGSYCTTVTINGEEVELSDGAWGCIAYSAITSLYEGDMALAMEYYLNPDYSFSTDFQKTLASYLSEAYMTYINSQDLSVEESAVGFDLDGDGDLASTVSLTIECDPDAYPDTNGYHGTYLDLYLTEFQSNLQWYLDNLDYAEGWTWFDADGNALSDAEVSSMSSSDKAAAFIEGRYAKGSSGSAGGPDGGMGGPGGGMEGGPGNGAGGPPSGGMPSGEMLSGEMPSGEMPSGESADASSDSGSERSFDNADVAANSSGDTMDVGTPDEGTTQSASSGINSSNYSSYAEMVEAYAADISEIESGDIYGNNIVGLYNPLNYIGAEGTAAPTWARILMGASEGDMSMFASLNMQIAWLNNGTAADIAWQWNGGHVPSEILGDSFALIVDEMVGKYADGAVEITKAEPAVQTANGTAESATGSDISSWVDYSDISSVKFSLADAAAYRTAGASKACPGFDVIDYGQEDYVFGSSEKDARHWNHTLLEIFQAHSETLEALF